MLDRHEKLFNLPLVRALADAHEEFAIGALSRESSVAATLGQRGAQAVREIVLWRQPGNLGIVAGPADADALVVDMVGPRPGVLTTLADAIVRLIAVGDNGIRRDIADASPG